MGAFMAKILVVDDQPMILRCLESALKSDGHDIVTVTAADTALKIAGFTSFDIIITDYSMPRMNGLQFLEVTQEKCPGVPVIMITGYGTQDTVNEAVAKGAFDYIAKPFSLDVLRSTVNAANEYVKARKNSLALINPGASVLPYPNIVSASAAMAAVCEKIEAAFTSDTPILIRGEPGTGKSVLARTIHAYGNRKDQTFLKINCAKTRPDDTVGRLIASADGGSLFFADVQTLPPALQEELLSILQTGCYKPGEGEPLAPMTARVLATSTDPLEELAAAGKFNKELLQILEAGTILVSPLRDRPEDVRVHIGLTLRNLNSTPGDVIPIEPDAMLALEKYPWPGNLPELEEALRNAVTMAKGRQIGLAQLPNEILTWAKPAAAKPVRGPDAPSFKGWFVKSILQKA
jgi:DNA-binding NtrC family response regulator